MERFKYKLETGTTEISGKELKKFIDQHEAEDVPRLEKLQSYFLDAPKRNREEPNEIVVTNNFAKYITYINNGYMLGQPVDYRLPAEIDGEAVLSEFTAQSIDSLDAELAETVAMFGVAYERIYLDQNSAPQNFAKNSEKSAGKTDQNSPNSGSGIAVRSVEYSPLNTFLIYDKTVKHAKLFAVNYLPSLDKDGKIIKDSYDVIILTPTQIIAGVLNKENLTISSEEAHFFAAVPVIEYQNNKHLTGDYESVLSLIDEYDFSQSDRAIDREKLVDAILAFSGVTMTEDDRKALKNSRVLSMPADAKGEYITKEIDESGAEVFRESLAADIHKFSFTPDLSDKDFAGNSSGVALLYKLTGFFWNISRKSRYFEAGLRERFELYARILNILSRSEEIRAQDIDVVFSGSLPKNDLEISQIISNLTGIVSQKTLISQLSFVENAETEAENLAKENEEKPEFDAEFAENEIADRNETENGAGFLRKDEMEQ